MTPADWQLIWLAVAAVALLVTLGGIFIVGTLIGLLTTGLSRLLEHLRTPASR